MVTDKEIGKDIPKENGEENKPQKMVCVSEAGGFISEADIVYYKGMAQRCDEIQEIMGRTPVKLQSWGWAIIAIATIGFICLISFLKVPKTADVSVIVPDGMERVTVVTPVDGTISEMLTRNSASVSEGDTILKISDGTMEYAVTAPVKGTVNLTRPVYDGIRLSKGEDILIISTDSELRRSIAYGFLTPELAAITTTGKEVALDNGLIGRIISVAQTANSEGLHYFEMDILKNSIEEKIPSHMTAKIIISDERLISKLWDSWNRR